MKVLALSVSDDLGGAARSAYRLHCGIRALNLESQMLVRTRSTADPDVFSAKSGPRFLFGAPDNLGQRINLLPLKLYNQRSRQSPWSLNWLPNQLMRYALALEPDIIHLNWIGGGFVPIRALSQVTVPLVWTLHDSWAFTGGCHLPASCVGYQQRCGRCPQLASVHSHDLSRWIWNQKRSTWDNLNLTIVTPSHWLAHCARGSSLLGNKRIEVIPNGLDLGVYHPFDKLEARRALNLPADKKLILFGAVNSTGDTNKGFHLLLPAIQRLASQWGDSAELMIFGASTSDKHPDMGLRSHYLGYVHNENSLAQMYSAADVFVAPSLQENLPNTILEALACGVPSVAFNVGGIPDLIDHRQTGYLAQPYLVEDLAGGIEWVLEDPERHMMLAANARKKVETHFELMMIAKRYEALYTELLSETKN